MIAVNVTERTRKFDVYVGEKKVGHVDVFGGGRVASYGQDVGGRDKFLATHSTLKQATDRILRWEGFGNSDGIRVIRANGGRKG